MALQRKLWRDLGDFSHLRVFYSQRAFASIYSSRMQDKIKKQILDAFFVVLRPIAKILLRYGIGFREFAEVAKSAFVDVATTDHGIRGRPTNISRVAVMTGLTRKEVRRIRDQSESGNNTIVLKTTPLSTVLHRWHSEEDYLDRDGRPAVLPFVGETGSFSSLVKRFGGDIPPGAMRTELKRVGALAEDENGDVRAIRRAVHPKANHENLCASLAHSVYPLISTIAHNTNPELGEPTWGQLTTFTADICETELPRIRRISLDRLTEIAESFDDVFMAYENMNEGDADARPNRPVAVGVFYFEEREDNMFSVWRD
jgi:hypothetical protein